MNFPPVVSDFLQSDFLDNRRPFCFLVAADACLQSWWGNGAALGFTNLAAGDDMLERAPYLLGHLGPEREHLPIVTTADGRSVEVHVLPEAGTHYVLLMDATLERDSRQERQQVTNELRLLHVAQEKLIERQRALIGDLVEAKTELDHRRREAERMNAEKNRFIAMMSHEFRTPLASIVNYADLALADGTSAEIIRKSAEAISRASRHLNHLVDAVLDDAQFEAGQIKLDERPLDLRELFDDIAAIMAPLAAEKQLSFGIYASRELPSCIVADDVCLRQVLINLLGNAVKYTQSGGVRLDVSWHDDALHAVVADTGPGIAIEDQQRIFGAFERAGDADGAREPGTGLGLTITLRLAKLMRGDIDLESAPGQGCRVTLRIPAPEVRGDADDDSALPEPDAEFRAIRPATILLCDDDEDLLALAEYYLLRAGYGVLIARNGQEAVEKALAYSPDLILMDINTPRLTGAAAASQLRKQGFEAPIFALTASDVRKLDSRDFTTSLRKPIQMPRLLAQIQAHI